MYTAHGVYGVTINSFLGLHIQDISSILADKLAYIQKLQQSDPALLLQLQCQLTVLIIEEISQLHGSELDSLNKLLQFIRSNDEPFGGVRVMLVGDCLQVPSPAKNKPKETLFFFQAAVFKNWHCLYLHAGHRQEEGFFYQTLTSLRDGEVTDEQLAYLNTTCGSSVDRDVATRLLLNQFREESIQLKNDRKLYGRAIKFFSKDRLEDYAKNNISKAQQHIKQLCEFNPPTNMEVVPLTVVSENAQMNAINAYMSDQQFSSEALVANDMLRTPKDTDRDEQTATKLVKLLNIKSKLLPKMQLNSRNEVRRHSNGLIYNLVLPLNSVAVRIFLFTFKITAYPLNLTLYHNLSD
jgi:hypothetical protein